MNTARIFISSLVVVVSSFAAYAQQGMKETVGQYCLIGSSLNQRQSDGLDAAASAIVRTHFNTAVAENCMKSGPLQPEEGRFDFRAADNFVDYCEQNGLKAIGHCLVWHSQAPRWFFKGKDGQQVTREELIKRIKAHIHTVVGRYKGRIHGWDVVNEAIEDNGSFRKSPFYNIIGEEFIDIAFQAAHEADPNAELYYNDYSMSQRGKRETTCKLVKHLKEKGLRIDGVGMQSHNGLDYPNVDEYEKSLVAFSECGVKVMITELDFNVLPNPKGFGGAAVEQNFDYQKKYNPYTEGLPKDKAKELNERIFEFFKIYYRHRDKIARINLWGISDANSWLNGWPVPGRTNYPLLFDRDYKAKPVVKDIIKLYSK